MHMDDMDAGLMPPPKKERQIKSKERVSKHGEVFTAEREVNAMLDLHDGDTIKSITLEMQEYPGIFSKKDCILDIIGTTNAGEKVLVEVQQKKDKFFRDRVQYYLSRVIENQVHVNEKYELPRIYFLGLLDFEMFPEEPAEYIHHVDEMCHGKKFFPKIQKVFVEIDKFFELENAGTTHDDNSEAAQWLRALKTIIKEEPAPEPAPEEPAAPTAEELLTEIRDLLKNK